MSNSQIAGGGPSQSLGGSSLSILTSMSKLWPSSETLKRWELSKSPLGMILPISHEASNWPFRSNRQIFSRSWQKIDFPSGAQMTDHHPGSLNGASKKRNSLPSPLSRPSRQ